MRFSVVAMFLLAGIAVARASGLDEANAGLAAARRGEHDEALRHFSAAIAAGDLSPFNLMLAHHNRANSFQDKGDYQQAIAEYEIVMRLRPNFAEAWFGRGRVRFAQGNFADAASDFAQSLKLDPKDAYSALWLHLAKGRGGTSDAGELARNATRFDRATWPGPVLALYLGEATPQRVRAALGQGDGAQMNERSCEAAFYIGEYELLRNNRATGVASLQDAAKICPFTSDELDAASVELQRIQVR